MMIVLLLCLIITEILKYRELKNLNSIFKETILQKQEKTPPKSRGSFVVKRMEERLKQALYE